MSLFSDLHVNARKCLALLILAFLVHYHHLFNGQVASGRRSFNLRVHPQTPQHSPTISAHFVDHRARCGHILQVLYLRSYSILLGVGRAK